MRVLLLTWDFPPARGGIQTWMAELARRLPDAAVRVVAPAAAGDRAFDTAAGLSVTRLGAARAGRVAWLVQLCARTFVLCIRWRPDLVVCGHVTTAPAAVLASLLLRVPYVVFVYGYEIRRRRRQRVLGVLLRRARMVLACSEFTRATALAHGLLPKRVGVVYPGVDPERFAAPPSGNGGGTPPGARLEPRLRTAAEADGTTVPAATILTVSRLAELYKGHDTAIRALPLVKAKCPGARYVIAGDGPLRDYLGRVARSLGVDGDVVFAGDVPDDALPGLYRSCDVFVAPSRESAAEGGAEGFGIVCLEAAASGKPVVAGRSGGLPDAVQDGVTGILVDPNDVGALADALVKVLSDGGLAGRLGAAGRARVLERFTWDRMAGEARRVFGEAVGEG